MDKQVKRTYSARRPFLPSEIEELSKIDPALPSNKKAESFRNLSKKLGRHEATLRVKHRIIFAPKRRKYKKRGDTGVQKTMSTPRETNHFELNISLSQNKVTIYTGTKTLTVDMD